MAFGNGAHDHNSVGEGFGMYRCNIPDGVLGASKKRIRQVYAFETPDRLPVMFGINERRKDMSDKFAIAEFSKFIYRDWKQEETEEDFEQELKTHMENMNRSYEIFPYGDFDPGLDVKNFQEVLLLCFGVPYQIHSNGVLDVYWVENPIIKDVEKDIDKIRMVDYRDSGLVARLLKKMKYFADNTESRISIRPFDMQAPLGMLMKMMDTNQFMMEFYDHPDEMRQLLLQVADCTIELFRAQEEAAGPGRLRHAFAPEDCPIQMADDLVSVLTPKLYIEIAAEANTRILSAFGGGMMHTCGPVTGGYMDAMLSVKGCRDWNDIFVSADKTRTAAEMLETKKRMAGKMVYNTLLPLDIENFTVDFVKRLMDGGGVYLIDNGPKEVGLRVMDIVDKASS
jgi:hypothetical protein